MMQPYAGDLSERGSAVQEQVKRSAAALNRFRQPTEQRRL